MTVLPPETSTDTSTDTDTDTAGSTGTPTAEATGLTEELLVEDVSIDGMCGVY